MRLHFRRNIGGCSTKHLFVFILFLCVIGYMNSVILVGFRSEWSAGSLYHGSARLKAILREKHEIDIKDSQEAVFIRDIKAFGTVRTNTTSIPDIPKRLIVPDNTTCRKRVELLIYVQSKWSNFLKRRYIRNSWGGKNALLGHNVKTIFVLGKPDSFIDQVKINNENLLFGDILQVDIKESFHNLSLKCLGALSWVEENCTKAEYFLKVDDDIFINLFKMFSNVLPLINSKSNLILCHVIEAGKSPIVRDKNSQWYIPPSIFPNRTHFPRFCSGYFVIMTKTVLHELYRNSRTTPLITVDDVYMFGHLAQGIRNLYFVDIKNNLTLSNANGLDSYKSNRDDYIGIGVGNPESMEELWSLMLSRAQRRTNTRFKKRKAINY